MAALLSVLGAALFVAPVFSGWRMWGVCDWDQHQFYYGVVRWSVLETGEPPFWNPFACGGNPLLANPQSPALYPLFAVVMALGVIPGLKILIWIHAALSLFGAWLFGRMIGCGRIASWLPAVAFGFSSAYALHIAAGHVTWFAMAWIPVTLAALRAGFDRPLFGAMAGAAASMTFLAGNIYFFICLLLFAPIWAALTAIARRNPRPLAAAGLLIVVALGLPAAKLLPMIDLAGRVSALDVPDHSGSDSRIVIDALLGRTQTLRAYEDHHPRRAWRWWEYGAYVGPVIIVLGIGHGLRRFRSVWPIVLMLALTLVVSLGTGYGAWDLLRSVPWLEALRVPSRTIVFAVLLLGALAGLWATEWKRRLPLAAMVVGVGLVALDVGWVGRASLAEAFAVRPESPPPGLFRQVIGRKDFSNAWNPAKERYDAAYTDHYPSLLANRGVVNCYERFHLPVQAQPSHSFNGAPNASYRGEAWLDDEGSAMVSSLGGRRMVVDVAPVTESLVVLNQNFDAGWSCDDGRPVLDRGGLLAARVTPGDRRIVFTYTPPGMALGGVVSILTLAGVLWSGFRLRSSPRYASTLLNEDGHTAGIIV